MSPQRLRQIAILVDSLDVATADRLLDQLPPEQQRLVRDAMVDLFDVDEEERQRVVRDFLRGKTGTAPTKDRSEVRGPETGTSETQNGSTEATTGFSATYTDPRRQARVQRQPALSLAAGSVAESMDRPQWPSSVPDESRPAVPTATSPTAPPTAPVSTAGFASSPAAGSPAPQPMARHASADLIATLHTFETEHLAAIVLKESPQILATILSLLPPSKSAELLGHCPRGLQISALERLKSLEELDEETIYFIQQELNSFLRLKMRVRSQQRVGPLAVADILVASQKLKYESVSDVLSEQLSIPRSTPESRPSITQPTPVSVTSTPQEVAVPEQTEERLASPEANRRDALADVSIRMRFEDFVDCDSPSLQAVLATAKPQLTLMALRGASERLFQKVLGMLPKNEASEVRFRVHNLGPLRVQDIRQAQDYLLRIAAVLEESGRFRRPKLKQVA